jgi:hypothetical protein
MSSPIGPAAAAARSIIYLGMDVHKESISIAVLPAAAKAPTRLEQLPNDLPKLPISPAAHRPELGPDSPDTMSEASVAAISSRCDRSGRRV